MLLGLCVDGENAKFSLLTFDVKMVPVVMNFCDLEKTIRPGGSGVGKGGEEGSNSN